MCEKGRNGPEGPKTLHSQAMGRVERCISAKWGLNFEKRGMNDRGGGWLISAPQKKKKVRPSKIQGDSVGCVGRGRGGAREAGEREVSLKQQNRVEANAP